MWNVLFSWKLGSTCSNTSKCLLEQDLVRMYHYVSDNPHCTRMNVTLCPSVFTDHYIGSVLHDWHLKAGHSCCMLMKWCLECTEQCTCMKLKNTTNITAEFKRLNDKNSMWICKTELTESFWVMLWLERVSNFNLLRSSMILLVTECDGYSTSVNKVVKKYTGNGVLCLYLWATGV